MSIFISPGLGPSLSWLLVLAVQDGSIDKTLSLLISERSWILEDLINEVIYDKSAVKEFIKLWHNPNHKMHKFEEELVKTILEGKIVPYD